MSFKKFLRLLIAIPIITFFIPASVNIASGHITCENSDYNCIYVASNGNRVVCTRAVCGGGSFGGVQYQLEGLYAFDGVNPNTVTTTTAATTTTDAGATTTSSTTTVVRAGPTISVSGRTWSATGSGACTYSGGVYGDAGFSQRLNVVTNRGIECNYSGGYSDWNFTAGQTYYLKITFTDSSESVTGTSSYTHSAAAATTTTLPPVTTTTIAGAPVNPCLDPANPNYACGWAVLGANNAVGNIIVCTYSVCGSGSFGGMRVVLQAQQEAGGNVAGWNGGSYDEKSQTFSLPGGGTLKSGDKLEEAVFPTTTVITIEPTTTAVSNGEVRASVGGVEVKSETTVTEGAVAVSVGEITAEIASAETTGDASNTRAEQGLVLSSGESADISIAGLQPNSEVEVVIYSKPRNLGSLKVNEFGELVASIVIPSDMESGPHTLVLSGFDKFGKQVELKFGLVVYSPDAYIPVWVWSLVGLLVISLAVSFGSRRSKKALIAI